MKDKSSISPKTQFCALIGNPVGHSMSPAIHNAAFAATGQDFVYVACQVEDVAGALTGMRALGNFRGMSVTIPHKIEVMQHVDEISETDRAIGSINTVICDNGKLRGLGTDGPGALKALTDAGVDLTDKTVLMLGCGGASRAIAFTLANRSELAELVMLDIDKEFLQGLTSDLQQKTDKQISSAVMTESSIGAAMAKSDIIIQCTPVGMHPKENGTLVPAELFRAGQVVFDVVYNPLETRLLQEAKAAGCITISGVEMFINQAILQFEQFTGIDAPTEVMRNVVLKELGV
ncbi:shikimate dehydrogenase [Malonomonas rubra DSM 5091]|uniref:Shikimate dehydrogenase (NADP(+)) n=1 Tax=Malonomonas rubra DSM 5091 TaxID=1122189 RepID=A0A1M6MM96_MALRU|nr:shikimate dehydrogenase [Malonomonas rubra]SHJ84413.1 shikimate dehydrogenase [Malonomonas rubra DSM 5091]